MNSTKEYDVLNRIINKTIKYGKAQNWIINDTINSNRWLINSWIVPSNWVVYNSIN